MGLALAVDLGTTSIAAVAVNRDGQLVGKVVLPNDAAVPELPAGHSEQDPLRLRAIAVESLRQLAQQITERPACLGVTGQMHGVIRLDAARRPISNLVTWQDRRANEPQSGRAGTYLDGLLARCPPDAMSRSGCRPAAGYLGATLSWLKQHDQILRETRHVACLADWMAAELAGGDVHTDPSNAAAAGIFDLEAGRWSPELVAACDIEPALLPELRDSGCVLGGLTRAMSEATGLPEGLPVCNAIGDNQAAVLGSVPAGEPAIQINIGTGGQINWPVERFVRVEAMDTRYLPPGRYLLVGAGLAGGDAYAWVNRTIAAWLNAFGVVRPSDEIYTRLNELAAAVPDSIEGLQCEPVFRGTRRQPTARGTFTGVTFENFTPGHVARSVLEGIARGMFWFYENAGAWQPRNLRRIVGSGNGLRNNPLLAESIERVFARPLFFPAHQEEAAFGAALLAGANAGVWASLEAAGAAIKLVPYRGARSHTGT